MDKQTNRRTEITGFQMLFVSPNGDYFAKTMRDAAQQCINAQISAFCANQNLQANVQIAQNDFYENSTQSIARKEIPQSYA